MKKLKSFMAFLLCAVLLFSTVGCNLNLGGTSNNADTHEHKGVHRNAKESTCTTLGKVEHWQCVICDKIFADAACTEELSTSVAPKKNHTFAHTKPHRATSSMINHSCTK